MFQYRADTLQELAEDVLRMARTQGADSAEVDVHESHGQSVGSRWRDVEQIEYQNDTALEVTVYCGARKGSASTTDLSRDALAQTVAAAVNIARHTGEDACNGLADAALMAKNPQDLDLYHPWALDVPEAVALAVACESAALEADARINNTEGANVYCGHNQFVYANSHGFNAYERTSRHSISCAVLAEADGQMQRDYWYDSRRDPAALASAEAIGREAAARVAARLGARQVPTGEYPVVFDAAVSGSLIGHLVGALSGTALYRKTTFLADSLGKQIFAPGVHLREEPHIARAFASAYFDAEGVATAPRTIVENGIIQGYFLSSYSARKLGLCTTANAGGAHNLILAGDAAGRGELLERIGTGLLVTELMGQGVNTLTGDYSRGAAGFWVENGQIAYPVEEITIASRLQEMFLGIIGIGNDALPRSTHKIGSIALEKMTVAGG